VTELFPLQRYDYGIKGYGNLSSRIVVKNHITIAVNPDMDNKINNLMEKTEG
jgi:hypothetical protein